MLRLLVEQVTRKALPLVRNVEGIQKISSLSASFCRSYSNAALTVHAPVLSMVPGTSSKLGGSLAMQGFGGTTNGSLLNNHLQLQQQTIRSVTKFSLVKGKRKSVKAVIKRFKRLHWGGWIRTYTGRHKKLFKKSSARKRRLRQHVLTNSTQSWLLDKMVTSFWRRPKYYVDDPYEPYHKRDEYFATKSKTFKV